MIDEVKGTPAAVVGSLLGLTVRDTAIWPCPACGVERRSRSDGRPPVTLRSVQGVDRWRCWTCSAAGSNLDAIAYALCGHEYRHDTDADTVRAWATGHGLLTGDENNGRTSKNSRSARFVPPKPEPPPRPDRREVVRMWRSAWRFDRSTPWYSDGPSKADAMALDWLERRNANEDAARRFWPLDDLGALDVARLLPPAVEYDWPDWWPHNRRHRDAYRLACLAFEANGAIGSIHARAVRDDQTGSSKTRWPAAGPGSAAGLIMAGPRGARLLRQKGDAVDAVFILEGITDLIAAELVCSREGLTGVVCLAGAAGSWGAFGAIQWPDEIRRGAPVYVRTDPDETGDKYAEQIARALWRPRPLNLQRLPWDRE